MSLTVVALLACTPRGTSDTTTTAGGAGAGTMAGIDSLRTAYAEAYNRRDVNALGSYFTDDAVNIASNGMMQEGRAAIQNGFPKDTAMWGRVTITPAKPATINGNMAWEVGTFAVNVGQGARTMTIPNRYLVLLQSDNGAWRIKSVASAADSAAVANAMKGSAPARR